MSSRCELPIAKPRLADVIEQGGRDPTLGERAAFVALQGVRLQLSDGLRGAGWRKRRGVGSRHRSGTDRACRCRRRCARGLCCWRARRCGGRLDADRRGMTQRPASDMAIDATAAGAGHAKPRLASGLLPVRRGVSASRATGSVDIFYLYPESSLNFFSKSTRSRSGLVFAVLYF